MKWSQAISIVVLIAATIFLGYVPEQSDFPLIFIGGAISFSAYGYLAFFDKPSVKVIFITGVFIRVILFFAFPNLSDDIYRFLWDGQLTSIGSNPYGSVPFPLAVHSIDGLSSELIKLMNSPYYYTIYPPFAQLIFYTSTLVGTDFYNMSLVIKLFFLAAEILTFLGILKVLDALNKDRSLAIIYFLNPLILVEGMVNLHFEIIMIVFLIWGMYFVFIKKQIGMGALMFTLSIASKLLPIMFLPFLFFGLKGKERIKFFGLSLLFVLIVFSPIIFGLDFKNFGSSIDLYFQKFEFNGGIYYVLRYLGKLWSGYNLIHYLGPLLGFSALILILRKAFLQKTFDLQSFIDFAFFSFVTYLLLATTVHPWYLSIPILLSVFVSWRFAVVWSFLILLTYINYSYPSYHENLWIVGIEYILVFAMIYYESQKEQIKTMVSYFARSPNR